MTLEFKNVSFTYRKDTTPVFSDVSGIVKSGEILHLMGANGAGKTTFAKCLLNILLRYQGKIEIDGTDVRKLSIRQRSRHIGYLGTNEDYDSSMMAVEYILLGTAAQTKLFELPSESQKKQALEILSRIGCLHLCEKSLDQLSQGERRMVSIARVLMQNPEMILLDEPTASLDFENQKKVMQLIKKLQKEGHSIINITHDPNQALQLKGYALLLGRGFNLFGSVDSVMTPENLSRLYHTEIRIIQDPVVGKIAVSC